MKPITQSELEEIAVQLQQLLGAELQDVKLTPSEVGLGFYLQGRTFWLWFDLNQKCPCLVLLEGAPPPRPKLVKPMMLFLRAHFKGSHLSSALVRKDQGRVLELHFLGPENQLKLFEVRLFPNGANIILEAGDKSLAFAKPKNIGVPVLGGESQRNWREICEEWNQKQKNSEVPRANVDDAEQASKKWQRAIEKKKNALEKMQIDLVAKEDPGWVKTGEWLKTYGFNELPSDLEKYVNRKQSVAENIEQTFVRAKDNRRKLMAGKERFRALELEIEKMQSSGPQVSSSKPRSESQFLEKAGVRGRRHKVSEDLEVYIGKSGADNLNLLRKAQPFDYWLHLRDYPGSHGIVRRNRGRKISDAEFQIAGRWVVEQSLHKNANELKGSRFEVLIVECRFVRPIKGDHLGRVHYSNDRVLVVTF